jgi:hypothetical protein
MIAKADYSKLKDASFKRKGVRPVDPKEPLDKNIKKAQQKTSNTAISKTGLEKWSIYVNPLYKRTLKIFAAKTNKKVYLIINEALKEYIKTHNIKKQ